MPITRYTARWPDSGYRAKEDDDDSQVIDMEEYTENTNVSKSNEDGELNIGRQPRSNETLAAEVEDPNDEYLNKRSQKPFDSAPDQMRGKGIVFTSDRYYGGSGNLIHDANSARSKSDSSSLSSRDAAGRMSSSAAPKPYQSDKSSGGPLFDPHERSMQALKDRTKKYASFGVKGY